MSRKRKERRGDVRFQREGPQVIANEAPSRVLGQVRFTGADEFGEHWECPEYYGILRRFDSGSPFGGGPFAVLSITAMKKLEKNRGRKWGAASATEPVEHVE